MRALLSRLRKILLHPLGITILLMGLYWMDVISLSTLMAIVLAMFVTSLLLAAFACLIAPSAAENAEPSFFKILIAFLLLDCLFNHSDES